MPEDRDYRHYGELLDLLDDAAGHLKSVRLGEWLLLLASILFAVPVAAVISEVAFHPTVPSVAVAFHLLLWALYAVAVVACLLLVVRIVRHNPTYEQVAVHVESAFPQLCNALINSVQLGRDEMVAAESLVDKIISTAFADSQAYDFRQSVDKRRLVRLAATCVACLAIFAGVLLGSARSGRLANAFNRLLHPLAYTPVVGSVRITKVDPGNATVFCGEDLAIAATVEASGTDLEGTVLYRQEGVDEPVVKTMSPVGAEQFAYSIRDIRAPFEYRLKIGDSETATFKVAVARRPEIERIDLAYRFPPYTGLKDLAEEDSRGNVRAVKGTRVTLKITATKDLEKGRLLLGGDAVIDLQTDGRAGVASLAVKDDDFYTVNLVDRDGYANKDPVSRSIAALPDRNPIIRFTYPGKEITAAPGETVKLALRAADDFGLSEVAIFHQESPEAPVRRLHEWKDVAARELMPTFDWKLDGPAARPGAKFVYYAEAVDNNAVSAPGKSQTPKFTINIEDRAEKAAQKEKELTEWERRLNEILKAQRTARAATDEALKQGLDGRRAGAARLKDAQLDIRTRTIQVAESVDAVENLTRRIKEVLFHLSGNEMAAAATYADEAVKAADAPRNEAALGRLAASQDAIIAALEKILGVIPDVAERIKKQPDLDDGYDLSSEIEEKLKDLADKLKDFAADQKKVIDATSDLAKRPVDDFSDEDEKTLQQLAAAEEKWSQFMKDTFSDFSKLPEQDFSNPSMLRELIQVQSEIQMAEDALKAKSFELATALEDAGLELAEAMTTHVEKWLPDTPDRIQWKMEEALGDYETPMAELPKELEDLVGDLLEEEEDIMEDMEDATATWADSIDKGAGWDAMDGPIMNMSAQGVTGNQLPNTSEMGGRSGEGRTGKSSGEFVGDTAEGKGGRKTPTRLTPDPFEKGIINDTGNQPPGGSTGGGKVSGASQEGLEGPIPPDLRLKMQGLAKRQTALLNKAEKISAGFQVAHWPSMFKETVGNLKAIEEDLTEGRYRSVLHKKDIVLKGLEQTRQFVSDQLRVNRDWSSKLPSGVQEEIMDSMGNKAPRGYEDLLKSYYETLSKTE